MSVQLGFKAQDIIAEGRVSNDDIKQINVWLIEQKNLPLISDEEIVNFLLSNDNNQEKTKNTIKAFFRLRNEAPDLFNDRLIPKENSQPKKSFSYFGIAPTRTKDNCVVILARLHDTRFQNYNMVQFFKRFFTTLDAVVYTNPPSGIILVLDMDGFGIMHLTKIKISAISALFRYLQEALPVQLKSMQILNTIYFIDKLMAIIKPFMSDHIYEMMHFYQRGCNMDEFFEKYLAKEHLPEELGGELPCMKILDEQLIQKWKTMESYFAAEEERRRKI